MAKQSVDSALVINADIKGDLFYDLNVVENMFIALKKIILLQVLSVNWFPIIQIRKIILVSIGILILVMDSFFMLHVINKIVVFIVLVELILICIMHF